jgi:hypothetical protein
VVVRPRLSKDETAAALAHELQHAVVVSAASWVHDGASMLTLYRRIGRPVDSRRFETDRAQQIGRSVRLEIAANSIR